MAASTTVHRIVCIVTILVAMLAGGPIFGMFIGGILLIGVGAAVSDKPLLITGLALVIIPILLVFVLGISGSVGGGEEFGKPL